MKTLIFGGAGFLGTEIVSRILSSGGDVVVSSRDEAKHWKLMNSFPSSGLKCIVCDIRDSRKVDDIIRIEQPSRVIIASALKQIPVCESDPIESVNTNVLGVHNVVRSCYHSDEVKVCLFVSSDKACSPVNVYGMCKSLSERIVCNIVDHSSCRFVCVRYGNVLNSTGSVIPLFDFLGRSCRPILVTDTRMTRFVMSVSSAVDIIFRAMEKGRSGDIFVPKLRSVFIKDLASIFSKQYDVPVKVVGAREGEKIHEIMINLVESIKCEETDLDMIIRSMIRGAIHSEFIYSSDSVTMSEQEVFELLRKHWFKKECK